MVECQEFLKYGMPYVISVNVLSKKAKQNTKRVYQDSWPPTNPPPTPLGPGS